MSEEHGVEIGQSTVREFVGEVRRHQSLPLVEVAVPQHHPLGAEAEVDFGTASVYLAGTLSEVQRSHYGFDSFFCVPGPPGAHEKGGVEGEVGRFRRRHLVPIPHVASVSELNQLLVAAMERDDRRYVASRRITVGQHLALEAPQLRPLPAESFEVAAMSSHRVDTKSRVSVRGTFYSVPVPYVRRRLEARVGAETVEVFDGSRVIAHHHRALKGEQVLVLDHYLEVLAVKPGALPGSTALARARASGAFGEVHQGFWERARKTLGDRDGTRALIEVLLLHRVLPAAQVITGMERALSVGSLDPAVVAIEARRATELSDARAVPIGEGYSRFDRPLPSLHRYDTLLEA